MNGATMAQVIWWIRGHDIKFSNITATFYTM